MSGSLAKLRIFLALLVLGLGLAGDGAKADSWAPPSTETRQSPNGRFRFTVEPSQVASAFEFFSEEVAAEKDGREVERTPPMGLLERREGDAWVPVWAGPLVNAVAPVSFLVSDDGRHVVTFDNWHSVGHGDNVIVIYGERGELVRSLSLVEILPQDYIDNLPHSVSSLTWKAAAELTGDFLQIDILVPSADRDDKATVRLDVGLTDGEVVQPPASEWHRALAASNAVSAHRATAEAARQVYLREPLLAPSSCDVGEWQDYMREAYHRLTPNWLDMPVAASEILFAPDHPRHAISVGWLEEAIADEVEFAGDVLIASPCHPEALVPAVRNAFAPVAPGSLKDTTLYVSADDGPREKLEPLIAPSGATMVWLDPSRAIPQRPERIPGSAEQQAAEQEMQRRQERQFAEMLGEIEGE